MLRSRITMVLAGLATSALIRLWKTRQDRQNDFFQDSIAGLRTTIASQAETQDARLEELERRLHEHAVRLLELPAPGQSVTSTEQLLSQMMSGLDERLGNQAASIEALAKSVAQTDELLRKLLDQDFHFPALEATVAAPDDSEPLWQPLPPLRLVCIESAKAAVAAAVGA